MVVPHQHADACEISEYRPRPLATQDNQARRRVICDCVLLPDVPTHDPTATDLERRTDIIRGGNDCFGRDPLAREIGFEYEGNFGLDPWLNDRARSNGGAARQNHVGKKRAEVGLVHA